jgi:hypothetical protein
MAVYLVTWNINNARTNYAAARAAFVAELDTYETIRDTGLETVRWVATNASATELNDRLKTKLDTNDRLFITQVMGSNMNGLVESDIWDWIYARV